MAIPTTEFQNKAGIALMRQVSSTLEWFFVRWVEPGVDIHIANPGAGTYVYALWLVIGINSSSASVSSNGDLCSLHLLEVSK